MSNNREWRGIMKVLDVKHLKNGKVIWESDKILNILHTDGEEFLLRAAFTGGRQSSVIPDNYYLGLDNRSSLIVGDTMDALVGEPTGSGYTRQEVSSSGDMTVGFTDNHFQALSKIVTFRAQGASIGPVSTLFLTDESNNDGYLICSASLGISLTVDDGDAVTLRLAFALRDCP